MSYTSFSKDTLNRKSTSIDHIAGDGSLALTREKEKALMKEYSVASSLAKTVREALSPDMSSICESYLGTKLTSKIRGIARDADGKSGFRPFFLSKFGSKLKGFDFNSEAPYRKVFKAKYHIKKGSRHGQVIVHFPAFVPDQDLKTPEKANYFKICSRLVALSDFSFDSVENAYRQLNKEYHGRYASFDSGMLPILKMPVDPITSQLSVDQRGLPEDTSLFLMMGVSFYTYEDGRFKHISKESSLHLEQVF